MHVRDLLARALGSADPESRSSIALSGWWHAAAPPRMARSAWPIAVRRGVVVIHAATSAWASEISLMATELLASLHLRAPELGARSIRAKVGPRPATARARVVEPPRVVAAPADPKTLPEEIARALANVKVDDVRDAVAQAAATSLAEGARRGRKRAPPTRS
jgi:Dna[CI] antecedent, DciA